MLSSSITSARPRPGNAAIAAIALGLVGLATAWFLVGAITQDPAYHLFADQRNLLAIPHAHNVLSNLPFALFGGLGLITLLSRHVDAGAERGMYLVFFSAVFLTAFGSGYYHLEPNDLTLVWDRLPMAIGFMSILAAVVSERINPRLGRALLPWLLAGGIASVFYWHWFDDLRLYALVQFGSLLALVAILLLHRRRGSGLLWLALAFYALAKLLEATDEQIFMLSDELISGHALKHLAAAAAPLLIWLRLLRNGAGSGGETSARETFMQQSERQS